MSGDVVVPLPPVPRFELNGNDWTGLVRSRTHRGRYTFEVDSIAEIGGTLDQLDEIGHDILASVAAMRIERQRARRPRAVLNRTVRRVRRWWTS